MKQLGIWGLGLSYNSMPHKGVGFRGAVRVQTGFCSCNNRFPSPRGYCSKLSDMLIWENGHIPRTPVSLDTFYRSLDHSPILFLGLLFQLLCFLRELRFSCPLWPLCNSPFDGFPLSTSVLASFLFISISLSITGFLKIWRHAGLLNPQDLWAFGLSAFQRPNQTHSRSHKDFVFEIKI